MPTSDPQRLLLLGRPECDLCEEFEAELCAHADFAGLRLEHGDVDSNPDWQRRYGLRIPVLLDAWNEVVCEGRFEANAFESWRSDLLRAR